MHATDDLLHRTGLMIAHAAAQGPTRSATLSSPAPVAEVRPTDAECLAYATANHLDGFTILPTLDEARARETIRLREDDGA